MKLQKIFLAFGMIGVISFFMHEILGIILLKGYNPITTYISVLTADGTPNANLMRTFVYLYQFCFIVFIITLCFKSFRDYHIYTKLGYIALLIMAFLSITIFGVFPMTINNILSLQNIIHTIITSVVFLISILAIFSLAKGYSKQEKKIQIGRLSLITAILLIIFNLMHLYAIMNGMNILGLMERLSVYTFHIFTFTLSWVYVFRKITV